MPLHLGKIAALIALLTIAAFMLWLMLGSTWRGEHAELGGQDQLALNHQALTFEI